MRLCVGVGKRKDLKGERGAAIEVGEEWGPLLYFLLTPKAFFLFSSSSSFNVIVIAPFSLGAKFDINSLKTEKY